MVDPLDRKKPLPLFDYQNVGAHWLAQRKVGLLADKQRLGKSCQAIHAAELVKAKKILVVCKAVARSNWQYEFEKFAVGVWKFVLVFSGGEPVFEAATVVNTVYITSYELLPTVLKSNLHFDVLIVDESQSIKELTTQRAQQVLGKNGICRRAKRTWLLTGTPTPNHAGELWTTLFTFGATKLKYDDFCNRFCVVKQNSFGRQITGTKVTDQKILKELQGILKKVMLRRTEKDVSIELPKISFSTQMVRPGRVHLVLDRGFMQYVVPHDRTAELNELLAQETGVLEGILGKNDGAHFAPEILEMLKANSKSISTLRRYTALQKLEPACELIADELASGAYKKCVIFAHHKSMIEGSRIHLQKFKPVTLYGGSNPIKAAENLKKFQNPNSNCRVFIGNITAAGTSIDLSVAHHIFFLEESFVPGDNAQASMRCGGVNQKNTIFVRNFCLEDSYDLRLQEIIREKTKQLYQLYDETPEELR